MLFYSMAFLITKILGYVSFYRHSSSSSWFITCVLICLDLHSLRNCKMVKINEDHPDENKHGLFIQSLLKQGSQPTSLAFGRDSKAGRGMEKLYSKKLQQQQKKGKLQVCLDWRCWHREARDKLEKWNIVCDWLQNYIWLSLVSPKLSAEAKIREAISY